MVIFDQNIAWGLRTSQLSDRFQPVWLFALRIRLCETRTDHMARSERKKQTITPWKVWPEAVLSQGFSAGELSCIINKCSCQKAFYPAYQLIEAALLDI